MGNTPGDETRNFVTKPSPFDRLIRSFASGMFKRPLNALKLAKLQNERSRVSKDYEAERLRVPVPEDEKYWTRLKYAPHFHLSEGGQAMLRKRVREEKKGRREAVSFWFNIITVILSLLVAILALSK